MLPGLKIRLAVAGDLDAINRIYNAYVASSTCTYDEEPCGAKDRQAWFEEHGPALPITVGELGGEVLGWASLNKFRGRCAYRNTVENSVYIDAAHHRKGIGALMLADLIARAKSIGHHTIIAGIDGEQAGSLAMHEKFGFRRAAHLSQVGFKFGRWLDVIYMQLML